MSDDLMTNNTEAPVPVPVEPTPAPGPARKSSTLRNVLIGVAGLVVLSAIVGIAGYFLLSGVFAPAPATTPTAPTAGAGATSSATSGSTTTTASANGTLTPIPEVTNRDVFSPHNPFQVVEPAAISSNDSDDSSSTDDGGESTALTLVDITTEDGEKVAVVKLGGTTYRVHEGDQVGDSDWEVVEIRTSSVIFLYGDERIAIAIGQGTSK